MANICDTTYKICGNSQIVNKLWNGLQELDVHSKNVWLGDVAEHFSIDYESKHIHIRGNIYYAAVDYDKDGYMELTIETETAWDGCHELFYAISEKLSEECGDGFSISYREIEPGCEIFCVHDEGDFFSEQCCVVCNGGEFESMYGDAFESIKDAINYWCLMMEIDRDGRDEDTMLELIKNYDYPNDDTYFHIYKFQWE